MIITNCVADVLKGMLLHDFFDNALRLVHITKTLLMIYDYDYEMM